MATYYSTTFGKISGRHGTAVSAIVEGEPILKVFTPPANPRTPAQVAVREKFAYIMRLIYPLRSVLYVTYGKSGSAIGQAFIPIWQQAVSGASPNFVVDWTKVPVAYGMLVKPIAISGTLVPGTGLQFTWDPQVNFNSSGDDQISIVLYDSDGHGLNFHRAAAARTEGTLQVEMPDNWLLANLKVWAFFSSADLERNSPSVLVDVTQQP